MVNLAETQCSMARRRALTLLARAALLPCAGALPALAPAVASAHDGFSIEATSLNGAVSLSVQTRVQAHYASIWSTLTDYDRLPRFVPCIKYSRVLERRGNVAVVEQKGSARVLFFNFDVDVTVETQESAPDTLAVRVLKGNLRQLDGAYKLTRLEGSENEYLLTWRGIIEPDFSVPAFISVPLMRASFREQFLAMVAEIERREAVLQVELRNTTARRTAAEAATPSVAQNGGT